MPKTRLAMVLLALCVMGLCQLQASAQGGWRQWNIYMLDGSSVEANPLGMRKDGRFTRSMGAEPGFDRSKIAYIAPAGRTLPPAPVGAVEQDLIVMLDGSRSFGRVVFQTVKFSEGIIVQNGRKMTLENVAYIKFAHPKRKTTKQKR